MVLKSDRRTKGRLFHAEDHWTKHRESTVLPGGDFGKSNLKETQLRRTKGASVQSTVDGSAELSKVGRVSAYHTAPNENISSVLNSLLYGIDVKKTLTPRIKNVKNCVFYEKIKNLKKR